MNIMVTGANGGYGSYAIDYLKKFAPDANIFGLVRNEAKGVALKEKGINVRIGDFSDKASLIEAFKGIDRLLFVSVSIPGIQKNVVDAAVEDGIKFISYTSIFQPALDRFGLEINHKQTENWINESGIKHVFLRNSWYAELNQAVFDYAQKTGKFAYFADQGKLSFALKREYAEAGARVIVDGYDQEVLNLAGKARSYAEIAVGTEEAVGKDLDIEITTANNFVPTLVAAGISPNWAGVSQTYQEHTLDLDNGEDNADPTEFEKVLGHPLANMEEIARELMSK
ncbi:NmrA family NAD(P)-binding protein [Companilactobacillus zhongbaensis]|uniref:NmrA family NAD(P)-binding protein n=1 Tax=Companilactobacillus zhongbaensis TaxID=2486009 RepID=UPI000F7B5B5D|nr:NAD(P)H-binding protein [Companilactobacillus zhongbaensis]